MRLPGLFALCVAALLCEGRKVGDASLLDDYREFFNFGEKKAPKIGNKERADENSVLKQRSKVEILGEVFKEKIDEIKSGDGKLDVVFLIDGSSSIGEKNFQNELKFVKKLLSDVTVDYNHSRVAVVTYSSVNNVIKNIDEISVPKEENNKCLLLNNEFGEIRFTGGGTYTLGAFKTAQEIFEKARNDSRKVLFLITDGYSNGGDPVPIAKQLKEQHVIIFTIGVMNGNYKELYELSSTPGEFHSYLLDSFDEFEGLARRALHVDLQTGEYIPLGTSTPCDTLCIGGSCCDTKAVCTCGTSTGHYSCVCQPGYYGSGLRHTCSPCPFGSYGNGPNLCLPCPDPHHTTVIPAIGIEGCKCKRGYQSTKEFRCEVLKCPILSEPEHGYFVKSKNCSNVLNSACGVRCEVGYSLEGNSIRLCQANATWSGFTPSCQIKTCEALTSPPHGSIICKHSDMDKTYSTESELPVDTVCSFGCARGRTLVGSRQRTCLPLAQWDGLKTSCKQVKCNKLPKVLFGKIEPDSCAIGKQEFGKVCSIICEDGFQVVGPTEKSCTGLHGSWNVKKETRCKDVTKPNLKCPDNVRNKTLPGKKFGNALWKIPDVTDNSGLHMTVWTKPSIKTIATFNFQIGTTNVTYLAQDAFKNVAKCHFLVEIYDDEIPTIEHCISPPPYLTSDSLGANVTWDEPNIFDNSQIVKVEKSHEFGFFKIGVTSVTYTAKDLSNNTNTCTLNITIEESLCEPLPDPIYGQSNCKSMDDGLQCVITCQEGYAMPITPLPNTIEITNSSTQFLCSNDEPLWFSYENQFFPECSVTEIPMEITESVEFTFEVENATKICKDPKLLNRFNEDAKRNLEDNLEETCNDILCDMSTETQCEDLEEVADKKSKRETRSSATKRPPKKARKNRKRKKIKVKLQLTAKNKKGGDHQLGKVRHKLWNVQTLNGNNVTTIRFGKTRVVCPIGCVTRKQKCVSCPPGTFQNATRNACQSCPVGYYNEKPGQTQCTSCPKHYSTRKPHAKHARDCVEQCPPGTFARKKKVKSPKNHPNSVIERVTLRPYCKSCPIGQYQSGYGQLSCVACPQGYTTTNIGSTNVNQCVITVYEMCSNSSKICNKGQCVVENDFYYSCKCSEEYIGSHCERASSLCSHAHCLNNGTCKSNDGGTEYSCTCQTGYAGENCQIKEEICPLNCLNNSTCFEDDNGEFICLCARGYGGELCEIKVQYCKSNICENGGRCVEDLDGYHCDCKNGYIGKRCTILPCDYQPCSANSFCVNTGSTNATRHDYKCECPDGYTGAKCTEKINYCVPNKCLNNATCVNLDAGYKCKCRPGFDGAFCENKLNARYVLRFMRAGVTDFVRMDGFDNDLDEISLCLWITTFDNFNYGTILSYATKKFDNTFTITDYAGLVVYINNENRITDVKLNDGFWHYFCFAWSSPDGNYTIYVDGKLTQAGTGFAKGQLIAGKGKMIIGQEQDIMGGRFSQSEAFLGRMTYFDVWSRVLTQREIKIFMDTCDDDDFGDVYAWPEIQNYIHGDVKMENTTFCKFCNERKSLYNGRVEVANNVAYYKCNKGFALSDAVYDNGRKCNKAGQWEGDKEPYCKVVYCGYPGFVKHAYMIGRKYYYFDKMKYICEDGYILTGNSTRYCSENGTWKPDAPTCVGVRCKAFKPPKNSRISVISDYSDEFMEGLETFDIGTSIEIICNEGSNLEGENMLTCDDNGEWSSPVSKCVEETPAKIVCSVDHIPPAPPQGYVVEETKLAYENGTADTVNYQCNPGHNLRGENVTTCILDGYWTQPNMTCEPVKCPKPPVPKNAKTPAAPPDGYHFGNAINHECIEGYRLVGNRVVRCQAIGRWSRVQARCIKKSCGKPDISESTTIEGDSYLFEDEVVLHCENNQQYTLKCTSAGVWLGDKDDIC